MSEYTEPCGMWPEKMNVDCGNPATLGWPSEVSGIVPICEDCIRRSGQKRQYLKKLRTPSSLPVPRNPE